MYSALEDRHNPQSFALLQETSCAGKFVGDSLQVIYSRSYVTINGHKHKKEKLLGALNFLGMLYYTLTSIQLTGSSSMISD